MFFDRPAAFHGDAFAAELAAAGVPATGVYLDGAGRVVVVAPAEFETQVRQLLSAHVPPAPAPDPVTALVAEVNKATTVAAMRNALVAHLPAAIRGR